MMKKYIYVGLGFIFFGLGAVGAILPILPTTPFLMVAAFFFAKGSEKFNRWFTSTKLYNDHFESFFKTRSMTLKTKISILFLATIMLSIGFIFSNNSLARIIIGLVFISKYYYFIFRIKTISEECNQQRYN